MKLSYNILWFEDDTVSYNGKRELVKAIIEDELGFHFPEPTREINGDNIDNLNYDNFDLLIADLNLAGTKGTALIDRIRHHSGIYTEVIFYSSEGEKAVRDALKEYEIDGAYCADRGEDFEDKVRKVIKTTIKKIQDLNNMRGLIMAETSDIDHTMLKIITEVITKNIKNVSNEVIVTIFSNVEKKVRRKKEDFDKYYKNQNIGRVIKDPVMFDSSEKIKAIQFIIDCIDHETTIPHKNDIFLNSYTKLKQTRDLLAHVIEVYVDGRKTLRSGDNEIQFTDEFCIEMRTKVKTHSTELDNILRMIMLQ